MNGNRSGDTAGISEVTCSSNITDLVKAKVPVLKMAGIQIRPTLRDLRIITIGMGREVLTFGMKILV